MVDILIDDILLEILFLELVKYAVFQRLAHFLSLGKKQEQTGNVSFGVLTAILLMIKVSWNMMLCHWVSSSRFQSNRVPSSWDSSSQRRWTAGPWGWRNYDCSKPHVLLFQQRSVTSQNSWIFREENLTQVCLMIIVEFTLCYCHNVR